MVGANLLMGLDYKVLLVSDGTNRYKVPYVCLKINVNIVTDSISIVSFMTSREDFKYKKRTTSFMSPVDLHSHFKKELVVS